MTVINLDEQRQSDRAITDRAAEGLARTMTANMNVLIAQCQGNVSQLRCCESLLTQMIDGLEGDRDLVRAAIAAAKAMDH